MKKGSFLLLALLLTSCHVYQNYPVEEKLTALPTPAHQNPVEVFFQGESRPPRPYLRVAMLKSSVYDGSDPTFLVQSLQRQAQKRGCDAVVITGQGNFEEVRTNIMTEDTYSIPGQSMAGIGIKYLDNLPEAGQFVCEKEVLKRSGEDWQRLGNITFRPDGRLQNVEKGARETYRYSLDYLLYDTQDWEFAQLPPSSYYAQTPPPVARRKRRGEVVTDLVKVTYRLDSLPVSLRLVNVGGRAVNTSMHLAYDEARRLTGRQWTTKQGKMTTQVEYDDSGRKQAEYFFREESPDTPFQMLRYHYCTPEIWEEALQQEQIIYPYQADKP